MAEIIPIYIYNIHWGHGKEDQDVLKWEREWDSLHKNNDDLYYINVEIDNCLECQILNLRRWAWVCRKLGYK